MRDSRAKVHGGSERFQAVGEPGLRPASFLLDPASLLATRVVSGGEGFEPPRDLTAPCDFGDHFEHAYSLGLSKSFASAFAS